MRNWTTVRVHISTISPGDTVFHDGHARTVSRNDLTKPSPFDEQHLFGDSYRLGYQPVLKMIPPSPLSTTKGQDDHFSDDNLFDQKSTGKD